MAFAHCIQLRLNRLGGIYGNGRRNGRRLSQLLRERVLDLHHDGMNPQLIANEVKSSRHFVRNVSRGLWSQQLVYAQNERNATSIKTRERCRGIFRQRKTLQTQRYKCRAAVKTFVRRDCSSCWSTIKVSDFKMYEGRPCHDKEKDSTGTIGRKKANKYWSRLRFSHFGHRPVVEIIVPQNVSHKVPTTFLYFICDQLWIHSIMVKV